MRCNLISLQVASKLVTATQNRLSTGKRVNTAMDDPVNFFAARDHLNRATDLAARKDGIEEAIQTMNAANSGIATISNMLESAKGILNAALFTSDPRERIVYAKQFDEILAQIDTLAADSSYKGTNLLKQGSLTVNFSEVSGQSALTITGIDATSSALGVGKAITSETKAVAMGTGHNVNGAKQINGYIYTGPQVNPFGSATINNINITSNPDATATYWVDKNKAGNVSDRTAPIWTDVFQAADSVTGDSKAINVTIANIGNHTLKTGDTLRITIGSAGNVLQRTFGTNYTAAELSNIKVNGVLKTEGVDYNLVTRSGDGKADIIFTTGNAPGNNRAIVADVTISAWETVSGIETSLSQVNIAMETLRTSTNSISNSSNILTTRLDFIKGITDTLKTGADNLTLADMNEESANMLMLATRQSLGTHSLSIASQAAQAVLRLFQ